MSKRIEIPVTEATTFPKFCPNCGQRRLLQDPVALPSIVFISGKGESRPASQPKVVKSIPYCTRCGFMWESMQEPGHAITVKLSTLNDMDLWNVMQFFYKIQKNLVTDVANKTQKTLGSVQRVIQGDRTSGDIKKAVLEEFRSRIAENGQSLL